MSTAEELVSIIEANGGRFLIEGEELVIRPGDAAMPLVEELRTHKAEIIALLQSRIEQETESAPDDPLPGEWLLERCVYRDRCFGGVGTLYLDLARWSAAHRQPAPESRKAFTAALQAEGFAVTADGVVAGLLLREDLEACERTQAVPEPSCKKSGHKTGHSRRDAKA
jgi:hypothetical protein